MQEICPSTEKHRYFLSYGTYLIINFLSPCSLTCHINDTGRFHRSVVSFLDPQVLEMISEQAISLNNIPSLNHCKERRRNLNTQGKRDHDPLSVNMLNWQSKCKREQLTCHTFHIRWIKCFYLVKTVFEIELYPSCACKTNINQTSH